MSALAIGQTTPPAGSESLHRGRADPQPVTAIASETLPLVGVAILALVLIALWPALSLVLPG